MQAVLNHLVLTAQLQERNAVRYTPAGLPAIDLVLKHESALSEDGQPRKVVLEMRAVAIGQITRVLSALALGSQACFGGFLASARNGRGVVFHLTQIDAVPSQPLE